MTAVGGGYQLTTVDLSEFENYGTKHISSESKK